jgi:hypothetical protein
MFMILSTACPALRVKSAQLAHPAPTATWLCVRLANFVSLALQVRQLTFSAPQEPTRNIRRPCLSKTVCPAHPATSASRLLLRRDLPAQLVTTVLSAPDQALSTPAHKVPTALRPDLQMSINARLAVSANTAQALL